MREIEFLPDWYPQAIRRQSILRLQIATALLVLTAMGTWSWQAHRNIQMAQRSENTVTAQVAQSRLELHQLDEQLELQRQLELQHRIVVRLGLPVEMSRVVQTLEELMPAEMSLVQLQTERAAITTGKAVKVSGPEGDSSSEAKVDRYLKVRMVAVTPSDIQLANFLAGLTNTVFFKEVAMTYSKDKSQSGHLMREFEVTFTMNLDESGALSPSLPRDIASTTDGED